ncbi:MAG: LysR substrate-binding domain-containing protein, partial [Myxococcota bacterium]
VLTARAKELIEPVDRALEAAQGALFHHQFDADRAKVRFVIATADYVATVLAPGFARVLQDAYPGVSVHFVQGGDPSFAAFRDGDFDLVLSDARITDRLLQQNGLTEDTIARRGLWTDEAVGIVREGVAVPSSLDDFLARPHAAFQFGPTFVGRLDEPVIERQDLLRNNRVLVPNFHLLPLTVLQSDCIAAVPESLARCYAKQLPLTVFPLPYEAATIHIEQVWMPRDTKSPRHRWLRDRVDQVVADTDFVGG